MAGLRVDRAGNFLLIYLQILLAATFVVCEEEVVREGRELLVIVHSNPFPGNVYGGSNADPGEVVFNHQTTS